MTEAMIQTDEFEFGEGLWLHFTPHDTREDAKGLEELIGQATLLIPEAAIADSRAKKNIQQVANGDLLAYRNCVLKGGEEFFEEMADILYRRPLKPGIKIEIVDVPSERVWARRMSILKHASKTGVHKGGYEATIEHFRSTLQEHAKYQGLREEVIVANAATRLRSPLSHGAKALMPIGSFHMGLMVPLTEIGLSPRSTRSIDDIPLFLADQIIRGYINGREPEEVALIEAICEHLIYASLRQDGSTEAKADYAISLSRHVDHDSKKEVLKGVVNDVIAGNISHTQADLTTAFRQRLNEVVGTNSISANI